MAITISNTTPRVITVVGGTPQTAFTVGFEWFTDADLKVYKDGVLQTLTTHYTATGAGVSGGGTVTFGSAVSNATVAIIRDMAIERTTDFPISGSFKIDALNTSLDKMIAMMLQVERDVEVLSLKADPFDTVNDFTIPIKATRASKIFGFDANGDPETTIATSGLATLGAIPGDISTVAGISANVTTVAGIAANVTAVAADATDIGAVAAKATEIGRLGTADAVADMNTLGTAAIVTDMDLLGTSANVTAMGLLGTSANVTAMSALSASAVITDMSILGTADVVNDMNILGTADVVTDMNVLATADVVTDMNVLATADIVTDMNLLATSANVTAMGLLGVSDVITDMGILGTADVVTDMNTLATADVVTDMNVLGTADVVTDMNTLGTSANVTAMSTVATNIAGVNSFAERYRVASSDPVSSLDEGDLYYNTTNNVLRYYNGSTWVATVTTSAGDLVSSNNLSDVSSATTALSNLGGVGVGLTLALGG